MTPIQSQQWSDFACMSEALIVAATIKGISLSPDDYRRKYENAFPNPHNQYGGLILSRFYWIARNIGLGEDMDLAWHYNDVRKAFDSRKIVFSFSGLRLNPNCNDPHSHTDVITSINDQAFSLAGVPQLFTPQDWIEKRFCGIIFA